jgi:hypothetical protein
MSRRKKTPSLPTRSLMDFPACVPDEVIAAVQQLYHAFAHRHPPVEHLNACIGCCMDPKLEREMRTQALRTLTPHHIHQYQDAAQDARTPEQYADEYAYFLPRIAEFISHGNPELVRHSTEIALDRLGKCARDAFSDKEYQSITAWCMALWQWYLRGGGWGAKVPLLSDHADALLVMFDIAGIPLPPLLDAWADTASDWALVQYGLLAGEFGTPRGLSNAFANDRPALHQTLHSWVFGDRIRERFAARWQAMDDAHVTAMLRHSPYVRLNLENILLWELGARHPPHQSVLIAP